MTIETVYLVEDHTRGSNRAYWAHVYLSTQKARLALNTGPGAAASVGYGGKKGPSTS